MNDSHDHAPAGPARVVLAKRKNAGIHVTLLWAEDTNSVAVLVHDDSTRRPVRTERRTRRQRTRHRRAPVRVRRVAWHRLSARRPEARGVTYPSSSKPVKEACIRCGRRIAALLWRPRLDALPRLQMMSHRSSRTTAENSSCTGRASDRSANDPRRGHRRFASDEPGYAKAAISFLVRPERGGSRVITETRVAGTSQTQRECCCATGVRPARERRDPQELARRDPPPRGSRD
jgi:hypothetical protein